VDRLVDSLLAGGVEGIFVLGTTGEARTCRPHSGGGSFSALANRPARRECLVYAGLGDLKAGDFNALQ